MRHEYQNKDWLETQYVALEKSTDQIAREIGVSHETIRRWLHKHNLPVRDKGGREGENFPQYEKLRDAEWLQQEYVEKERSAEDIASDVGCVGMTVLNALRREGIERRDCGNKMNATIGSHIDTRLSDKDWLVTQINKRERSISNIAREVGVTPPAVQYWMSKFGIEYNSNSTFGVRDKQFQRDPQWDQRRKVRLESDNYTCQDCGEKQEDYERSLDVHHLRRKDEFVQDDGTVDWEKANAPENLISLCRSCHIKRHTNN